MLSSRAKLDRLSRDVHFISGLMAHRTQTFHRPKKSNSDLIHPKLLTSEFASESKAVFVSSKKSIIAASNLSECLTVAATASLTTASRPAAPIFLVWASKYSPIDVKVPRSQACFADATPRDGKVLSRSRSSKPTMSLVWSCVGLSKIPRECAKWLSTGSRTRSRRASIASDCCRYLSSSTKVFCTSG